MSTSANDRGHTHTETENRGGHLVHSRPTKRNLTVSQRLSASSLLPKLCICLLVYTVCVCVCVSVHVYKCILVRVLHVYSLDVQVCKCRLPFPVFLHVYLVENINTLQLE